MQSYIKQRQCSKTAPTGKTDVLSLFLSDYCLSAPEHNVVVMPEREKEPDWKTGDRNISGTRNRNRCNGTKSETPKPGQSAESSLKQNGGHPLTASLPPRSHNFHLTDLVYVQQVRVPLALDGSALQSAAAAECASRARTPAARRAA